MLPQIIKTIILSTGCPQGYVNLVKAEFISVYLKLKNMYIIILSHSLINLKYESLPMKESPRNESPRRTMIPLLTSLLSDPVLYENYYNTKSLPVHNRPSNPPPATPTGAGSRPPIRPPQSPVARNLSSRLI